MTKLINEISLYQPCFDGYLKKLKDKKKYPRDVLLESGISVHMNYESTYKLTKKGEKEFGNLDNLFKHYKIKL